MQAGSDDKPTAQKAQQFTDDEREVFIAEVAEQISQVIKALADFREAITNEKVEAEAFNESYARLLQRSGEIWLMPQGGRVLKAVVCRQPLQPVAEFLRELATSVKE